MRDLKQYPFEIQLLTEEDGGGYLISFPDFSECISDGETVEEAIQNGLDALEETIAALESIHLPVPEPGSGGSYSATGHGCSHNNTNRSTTGCTTTRSNTSTTAAYHNTLIGTLTRAKTEHFV